MHRRCFLPLLLAVCVQSAHAADKPSIAALLERPIIEKMQPLAEVKSYCEARIPRLPAVTTVAEWEKHANQVRKDTLEQVVYRGEAAAWRDAHLGVEWLDTIDGGPGYRIKKLRYEALPGLWIPALLYEPENLEGRVPVGLNVNGHDGKGKAADYKQIRCINQAKRGMLALNVEWLGMGQLTGDNYQHSRMNQIDLCGTSGLAPFYLAMKRGLDVLLSHEHADPARVAVSGLSGGGWQTIFISSLDDRVTLANPVAGYSSLLTRVDNPSDLGDSEQTPVDMATAADYHHLTALRAPRPTLLTYNAKDNCCFQADHALPPLLEASGPIFELYGRRDCLRSHVNDDPGTHNFEIDNRQQFYQMLGDFFFADRADFDAKEIPCDAEVKTAEQLLIDIPAENANFHSLAVQLSQPLPEKPDLPERKRRAERWQENHRKALVNVVKSKEYAIQAASAGTEAFEGGTATFWKLSIGGSWTVPVTELTPAEPKQTVILVADGGRKAAAAQAEPLVKAGNRVLAVDPFYFGESKIEGRDVLLALLVGAVGDRPLGIQASQISAIAAWAKGQFNAESVHAHAIGPRSSLYTLVAAGLNDKSIAGIELSESYGSLKEIIEKNMSVQDAPELFCFGLLKKFDIRQLTALVAPRPVKFVEPSERAKQELAGVDAFYKTLDAEFDPLK